MKQIAIVYHSAHGHTRHIAECIAKGAAGSQGADVQLLDASAVAKDPAQLASYHGIVLGSPTYLGGVSGPFKSFMDSTGRMWRDQALRGKLAAGFTVSSLPAGDKQSTLISMFTFAMQHGMHWVGNAIIPEQHAGVADQHAANRLGSWTGLMAQAGHASPSDAFPPGDTRTARMFGRNFVAALERMSFEEDEVSN